MDELSAVLTKGQNGPLDVGEVLIDLELTAPADISALLVTASGTVRSDADFVFFNQPTGPGVRLVPTGSGPARVAVTLAQVPSAVEQIRIVITLDDARANFGRFPAPTAHVLDATGARLYSYTVDGLGAESVVIALEVYRRQAAWKVRAVGQGYAGGFAALIRDHGVSVDDAPAAAPPAPQVAPTPPPAPTIPPAPPAYTPPAYTPPAYTPPAYTPPAYTPPAAAPTGPPEVSLTKAKRVDLSKGQKVTLRKEGGVALTTIKMGLGWDPVKRGMFAQRTADVDLDASALMFAGTQNADVVYYGQLTSKDGSIRHEGDNLTGEGEGDDEVINIDLTRVHPQVTTIVLTVTSYRGQTFEQVDNAFTRLVDLTTGAELARFTLQGGMPHTGLVMAKLYRAGGDWKLQALGEGIDAKHAGQALPQLGRFLAS